MKRNELIIHLFKEGKSIKTVGEVLFEQGFGPLSKNRLWAIWRQSADFKPKKTKTKFCNLCLTNMKSTDLYFLRKDHSSKTLYRVCDSCWTKILPPQPIESDKQLKLDI